MKKLPEYLKTIIYLLLLALGVWYAKISINEFLEKQTSFTVTKTPIKGLLFHNVIFKKQKNYLYAN